MSGCCTAAAATELYVDGKRIVLFIVKRVVEDGEEALRWNRIRGVGEDRAQQRQSQRRAGTSIVILRNSAPSAAPKGGQGDEKGGWADLGRAIVVW